MRRARQVFLVALALSLAAHFLFLNLPGLTWRIEAPMPPIEASLAALNQTRLAEVDSAPPPRAAAPARPAAPASAPLTTPEPVDASAAPAETGPPETEPPAAETPVEPTRAPAETPSPAPGRAVTRAPPGGLEIRYAIEVGEDRFVAGRSTYRWQTGSGRYRLENTIEATGVVALFMQGRIAQTSEGWVDGGGLRPERYTLTRGNRAPQVARFDWLANRLELGSGPHALHPQAQDLLSFPFHLALTARAGEPDFVMWVTNGRRFRDYAFRMLGEVVLEIGEQRLATLHLRGERPGESHLDVWMLPERGGVPVKVRTLDEKGQVIYLILEGLREIEPE